jgi:hypothetical protein
VSKYLAFLESVGFFPGLLSKKHATWLERPGSIFVPVFRKIGDLSPELRGRSCMAILDGI